ncbi:hypothetical protein UFOVP816_36 [uncultured Caudovirales phage]|uniref:Uncharacterized protein n=1 Tax=uncultured Caudovirales phage TaxID=2100421 RepID=A0A6J5NY83_9CAUD|nr:hypothetical protein UFOVP816_36 [uncultured Caudovirales phage]
MARKPSGKPTGRPPAEIDWKLFEQLCFIQCTQAEIASFFKIVPDTLIDRTQANYGEPFSSVYKRFSDGGKSSLRRTQFRLAEKNTAMAIWLGKQYLGQSDNFEKPKPFTQEDVMKFDSYMAMLKQAQQKAEDAKKTQSDASNTDSINNNNET